MIVSFSCGSCSCLGGASGAGATPRLAALDMDDLIPDAAHLDSPLDPDVALLSPARAPGVLDEPEVNTILSPVANNNNSVVSSDMISAT